MKAAYTMHSLRKKCCLTSIRVLSRHLRTCSVALVPRGVANSDRSVGHVPAEENTPFEIHQHLNHHENHKDTRSLDDIDPVILKYTNLLNDMSGRSGAAPEKVHATNFGSIRFDSENVPRGDGYFDSSGAGSIIGFRDVGVEHLKQKSNNGDLEPVNQQLGNPAQQISDSSFHESPTIGNGEGKSSLDEDEKAFDELFSGGAYENKRLDIAKKKKMVTKNDTERSTVSTKDFQEPGADNFIDDQFFGRTDSMYSISSENNNPYHQNSLDFTKTFDTQNIGSSADMNYIDQAYFQTSLDTLRENRKPAIEYREIEKDLQRVFNRLDNNEHENTTKEGLYQSKKDDSPSMINTVRDPTSNIALEYLGIDPSSVPPPKLSNQKMENKQESATSDESAPKSAYDYVLKKRKDGHDSEFNLGQDAVDHKNKSYQKILSLVRERSKDAYTKQEMLSNLKRSIIYNMHDIVGLYKPYGVAMHEGTEGGHHTLTEFLPQLAQYLKVEDLHIVHRLDATSTGVLLLARTTAMADTLKAMFKNKKIKKNYWAITKGIPSPLHGIIDIPIAEGTINGKYRMVLRPDVKGLRGSPDKSHKAVTEFRTISKAYNTALVELKPETGVKHQLRVHLGFGLACPILGDHKYSHLKKMAPQRLPGDTLDRFKLEQSKVRNLPLFLHSRSVIIPEIIDGRNIFIQARLPAFFNKALSSLKLNTKKNQVRYVDSKPID